MALQLVRRSISVMSGSHLATSITRKVFTRSVPLVFARGCSTSNDIVTMAKQWDSTNKDDIHVTENIESKPGMEFTGKLFSEFSLHPDLLSQLHSLGLDRTFEVQDKTLPLTLDGKDVIGRAITGSGKTLAFALPIVHVLSKSERTYQPRAIVITPTRELCNQVTKSVQELSKTIRCASIYGGDSYSRQERDLRGGVDVVCGTPGRLNDHLERGNFTLENVQFLVLDEADELLTPNFLEQIKDVLNNCPSNKQMMLFSATMPHDAKMIAQRFMRDPVMVDLVTNRSIVPSSVSHEAIHVPGHQRRSVVGDLLIVHKPKKAIVFTHSRVETLSMAQHLRSIGIHAEPLNSDLSQPARESCLNNFRTGRNSVLVATDVAARGIDVPETDMVVQVDPPPNGIDFYIHRSGRTGRKGQAGRSIIILAADSDKRGSPFKKTVGSFMKDMKHAGINVTTISPPSEEQVVAAMMEYNWSRITKVDSDTAQATKPHVLQLLGDMDSVDALAAAMAVLSDLSVRRWRVKRRENDDRSNNRRDRGGGDRGFDKYSRSGPRRESRRDDYVPRRRRDDYGQDSGNWRADKFRGNDSFRDDRGGKYGGRDPKGQSSW